ncbi:MAG TPA: TonB-dependent receptor [Bryobacteraceae bacterium]|nr:TonB-dependent receptor [Bryobacteraceae bacterium]
MLRVLLLCAMSVALAWAQIGTSTITGRVTDSSGAIIAGARVTVVQKTTNFTFNADTNTDGFYRVVSLQPGDYRVTVEAAGFKKAVFEDIVLTVDSTRAIDVSLTVGQLTETVEVTSTNELLETATSSTGTVVSGNTLYELPLYQRYVNSTLNLVPGMTSGGYAYGGSLGSYHLAGQRNGAIGIFEDGVNGNDQVGGTETIKPLQNSVAEVKVISTVPPAEYGHSAGGVVNVVKKSGTNEYHGMASWYGRTRNMQHRLYFDKFRTSDPTPTRPNGVPVFFMQPDANIGGPIVKNKTFFFFGYQRLHEKKVAQVTAVSPTAAMKAGDFNFPGTTSNVIYDPASTRQVPVGTGTCTAASNGGNPCWTRDPFAGNIIPQSRFDPVARNVLGYDPWVAPNMPGSFNSGGPVSNLLADEFAKVFFNDYNLRIDHQFSNAFKLYGSYTQNDQSGFQRPINIKESAADFDGQQGNYNPFSGRNASLGYTWVASPSIINDSRVGYLRRRTDFAVPSYGEGWASTLGIPNVDDALMPRFSGDSTNRDSPDSIYGLTSNTPYKKVYETFSFRNDTTWITGSHAFKLGYEILQFRLNFANFARPAQFSFSGVTAGLQPNGATVPNTGNTFAGFLTGYVSQGLFTQELTSWLPRSNINSFYIQDDWRVTPTLTLNLGVRYSNESPFNTKNGAMSNFDPTMVDDVTGRPGAITHPTEGLSRRDNNNFNPRVGLAWHPAEKWVFRGGFGMYTVDIKFPMERGNYDEYVATANQQPAPGNPTPVYQISSGPNPLNFNVRPNNTSPFVGSNFGSRSVEYWDPNLRNPYTMNWNAGVQYEFKNNWLLDASYQGSGGVGLIERWQYNTFPVDYFAGNPTQQNAVFAASQNYRPFNQFGDVRMRSNFGHSTFHSGTVKLDKRMSEGLMFSTFYTFSKAINSQDNDNDGSGVAPIQNRSLEKARAGYDRNHRWLAVVNYELPFGAGKKWAQSGWKKWVVGGFELSWIQTMESGNPLTFTYANSPYNYYPEFAGNRRPDVIGDPQIRDGWYDTGGDRFNQQNINSVFNGTNNGLSNFALPGGCPQDPSGLTADQRSACNFRVGNIGRNTVTGTPLRWSQVSAQKNFVISERWKAQLRWDFQNALKTYNFDPPTRTVDFRNPLTFGKVSADPRTASLGGQPLMNLTLAIFF